MFKRFINSLVCLILLISVSGCGTLFSGTSELVTITSLPEKAKVYVNGLYIGVTPVPTSLKRDQDHSVIVKKDGYEDASAVLTRKFNAVSILNTISILCWIVDAVTGGMWKFDRNVISVELEEKTPAKVSK
jgi:hypothetical protein